MTRTIYIIGGAGTGKSTFMEELTVGLDFGPLEDFYALHNKKALVTLRGHRLPNDGLYLGCMRASFPGTDGLDRASSPVGAEWLSQGDLPAWIVSEGSTLATRRFLAALHEYTNLLVVHLYADDFVKELRFLGRGSNQKEQFVTATATRSANLLRDLEKDGVATTSVDTAEPLSWDMAIRDCKKFLKKHYPEG